jgi:hypothetical protein
VNVSAQLGALISWEPALVEPLTSTLGLEDMHDLIEVMVVDRYNDRVMDRHLKAKEQR